MKTTIVLAVVSLVAAAAVPQAQRPATASHAITIEQLIDIKHPSNPVWSREGLKIAFTWERAGVANLYVVPADGSSAPAQVTKDGVPGNVFWGPDGSLLFFRGAALMTLPLNGSAPTPRFGDFAPRSPSVSRDGSKVVYLGANNVLRVRSLVDGTDVEAGSAPEGVTGVSWIDDKTRALTGGGGRGEVKRHEQTPDYSGAKIIYTITERLPGAPAGTWVMPIGGTAKRYSVPEGGGGFGGRGGGRWLDANHFLFDRTTPDFKRRAV